MLNFTGREFREKFRHRETREQTTQTDTPTDQQTDRKTDRPTDRQADRQTNTNASPQKATSELPVCQNEVFRARSVHFETPPLGTINW